MCEPTTDINLTDADVMLAMSQLPERQRLAFFLVQVRGMTTRQAAAVMGISQAAVVGNLQRARDNVKLAIVAGLPGEVQVGLLACVTQALNKT